ncbi:hypothetical protein [Gimesia algae]|uniref:hypothetical protein n=1 Tax=Gimesia algae TaxID=2527971 RepID=UPI0011AA6F74|nr:hypothetical protein [Gimesia algae]
MPATDHAPEAESEKLAAEAFSRGKTDQKQIEKGVSRHAGPICRASPCIQYHLPNHRSTATRFAGLIIPLPVKEK